METLVNPQAFAEGLNALQHWMHNEVVTVGTLLQCLIIIAATVIAMLLAPAVSGWIRTWHRRVESETRIGQTTNAFLRRLSLSLIPLSVPVLALPPLWIAHAVAQAAGWPHQTLRLAVSLLAAWVVIRLTSSLVRDRFWARSIAVLAWTIAALNIFGVLDTTFALLGRVGFAVGGMRISPIAIVTGLLWLAILLWLATWIARLLESRVLAKSGIAPSLQVLFARIVKVLLIVAAVFIALGTIGIDLTAFAVFTGALGVGIGFGLQAIFNNFIAGLILLSEKSLKVGDFVDLEREHLAGTVRQINIRNTIITTPDNIDVAVPNSEFVNGRFTNWTMLDAHARIHVPFGVAYGTESEMLRRVVFEAVEQVKFTLKGVEGRDPQLWLVRFGESRLELELVVWLTNEGIHRPAGARAAYAWAIYDALRAAGIVIPFPQRDVHLRGLPAGTMGASIGAPLD